jgi:protein TonB
MRIAALLSVVLAPWMLHAQDVPRIRFQGPPPSAVGTRAPNGAVRISGGVMAGMLVNRVDPVYPDTDAQGTVVLHAIIGPDGTVQKLTVIAGPQPLQSAALAAVHQWVYKPYLLNGNPVTVDTTIVVNFRR